MAEAPMTTHDPVRLVAKNMRVDLRLIADMIAPGSRGLDTGSGVRGAGAVSAAAGLGKGGRVHTEITEGSTENHGG